MADYTRPVTPNVGADTTYINARAIERLEAALLLADACTPGTLPNNAGSTLRWIVDQNIAATAGRFDALIGRTGGAGDISYGTKNTINEAEYAPHYVEKRLNWYGEFVPVRQVDLETMPRGEMDRLSDAVGYAGAESLNALLASQIDGRGVGWNPVQPAVTGSVRKSAAGAGGDDDALAADDLLSAEDIFLAKGDLRANNVHTFPDGKYRGYIHPLAMTHLQTDVDANRINWSEINKYVSGLTGQTKLLEGEGGAIGGVMLFETTDIHVQANVDTTISGYANLILGKDAIGCAQIGDMDPQVKIHRSNANSIDDPYEMWATVAWRLKTAPVRIQETGDTDVRHILLYSAVGGQ